MPPNITELRPDLKLLVKNFEGYKLSLDTVPVIKYKLLPIQPNVMTPNIDQYSLLHATLYGLHNHLFKDPFESYITYVIDMNNVVNKYIFNRETQRFFVGDDCQFQLPQSENIDKIYNSSMKFISKEYVVISKGSSSIYIVNTVDRANLSSWTIVFSQLVVEDNNGFIILDARLEETEGHKTIHCLIQHIEKADKSFENIIDWIIIKQDTESSWILTNYKQLLGKGTLQYCAFESGCKAVYIASDRKYKFKLSDEEIRQNQINKKSNDEIKSCDSINWYQSEEEITILVTFKEFVDKKLLSIKTTANSLNIVYKNKENYETALELFDRVDVDLTTWSMIDSNILEIVLYKSISKPWKLLNKGETSYKEIPNPVKVAEIHEQLKHLCSENESETSVTSNAPIQDEIDDCDFDVDYDTKDWSLERLCPEAKQTTHHIYIGSNGPLFKYFSEQGSPPLLALRHDVDGLIWQMPTSDQNWPPNHIGTLPAFGYVQASKQEKKFVSCSPDFNYSVICNGNRHIFIYWGDGDNSGAQLQNRKSKQKIKVGTQKVITLDNAGDIIGLQTENDTIIILTVDYIIALQLNIEVEP